MKRSGPKPDWKKIDKLFAGVDAGLSVSAAALAAGMSDAAAGKWVNRRKNNELPPRDGSTAEQDKPASAKKRKKPMPNADDATKAQAIEMARTKGPKKASREFGYSKGQILRWARDAGVSMRHWKGFQKGGAIAAAAKAEARNGPRVGPSLDALRMYIEKGGPATTAATGHSEKALSSALYHARQKGLLPPAARGGGPRQHQGAPPATNGHAAPQGKSSTVLASLIDTLDSLSQQERGKVLRTINHYYQES